jgi:hypothetical protein
MWWISLSIDIVWLRVLIKGSTKLFRQRRYWSVYVMPRKWAVKDIVLHLFLRILQLFGQLLCWFVLLALPAKQGWTNINMLCIYLYYNGWLINRSNLYLMICSTMYINIRCYCNKHFRLSEGHETCIYFDQTWLGELNIIFT